MNRLNKDHFSFKCPMTWENLDAVSADKRFCQQCDKNVYDLTNCSLEEAQELQREKGAICGMVRLVGTTTVAASLSMAACSPQNQHLGAIPPVAPEKKEAVKECGTSNETAQETTQPEHEKQGEKVEGEAPKFHLHEPMIWA